MGGIATVSIYLLAVAIVLIIICFVGENRHQKKSGEQDNMPDSTPDSTTNSTANSTTTEDA